MAVGFTGTRKGMTPAQIETLRKFKHRQRVFHHGACEGADMQAAELFSDRHWQIHAWPSYHPSLIAMAVSPTIHWPDPTKPGEGWPPLQRNHLIVDATDLLIATPGQMKEVLRSGTWATIRYALSVKKPVYIIWPDGTRGPR